MNKYVVKMTGLEPNFDVDISRKGKWGNPFVIGIHGDRREVVRKHRLWLQGRIQAPHGERPPSRETIQRELRGKRLGCHCAPRMCHGDNLSDIANAPVLRGLFKGLIV